MNRSKVKEGLVTLAFGALALKGCFVCADRFILPEPPLRDVSVEIIETQGVEMRRYRDNVNLEVEYYDGKPYGELDYFIVNTKDGRLIYNGLESTIKRQEFFLLERSAKEKRLIE